MKIALIVNNYPPKVGGVEFHAQNLARELTRLGHRVWVLTIAKERSTRQDDGVTVMTGKAHLPIADVITVPSLGATRHIEAFLRSNQIDLVSVHTRFFPMSLVGLRAAHRAGIPVIHTEHGSGFVASGSPVIALGSRTVDYTMGRYILRRADKVLGVSERVVEFVKRLAGVEAEVFYNAITPSLPRPEAPSVADVHTDRPNHLVFVGRMVEGKGWDTFIDSVAELHSRGFDVTAELIGDGPQLDLARQRVKERGVEAIVEVVGRVSPAEVREHLSGATLVNPTVLSEGFQTTLVEAIAEGGRVVTFDVPGAQMLKDRAAPVAISAERTTESLTEETERMLANPPAPAAPEVIEPLTWPAQARNYAGICEQVVSQHRSR